MSLRGVKKVLTELNAGLRIYKFIGGVKPNYTGTVLDTSVHKEISLLNQQLSALSLSNNRLEKFCSLSPILDTPTKKTMIEPSKSINFKLPIKNSNTEILELPLHTEKEIAEPGKVISKKAIHIISIRKRKMRKHKWKKYLRKHKVDLAQRRLERNLRKEGIFQNSLRVILNEKDEFSAEKYVSEMLEKAHWQKPVNKVRGKLAPRWVIQEHLRKEEENRILKLRIEECTK